MCPLASRPGGCAPGTRVYVLRDQAVAQRVSEADATPSVSVRRSFPGEGEPGPAPPRVCAAPGLRVPDKNGSPDWSARRPVLLRTDSRPNAHTQRVRSGMADHARGTPDQPTRPSRPEAPEPSGEVFINGQFVQRSGAMLSAFDAAVQHGIGLFETMRAGMIDAPEGENIGVFRLTEHLERLQTSARELGLSERLRVDGLADAIIETVRRSGVLRAPGDAARVRLTITGGDLNLLAGAGGSGGVSAKPGHQAGVMIVAQPATAYPEEMYTRGVRVGLADWKTNAFDPFASHKTVWYWPRLRELQTAAGKGFGEALVFSATNHLAGGCVSNAFVVRNGELITPIARGEEAEIGGAGAIPSPVLPGVTRGAILDWAEDEGLTVERRMVVVDDVLDADEVFLTNASWGVMPVIGVESKKIGEGALGEITARALAWWQAAVRGEA